MEQVIVVADTFTLDPPPIAPPAEEPTEEELAEAQAIFAKFIPQQTPHHQTASAVQQIFEDE